MMAVALVLVLWVWLSTIAASAGELLLSPVGNGQWQVSATDLKNVHALDLQLIYDPQRLSGLTATAGSGLAGAMSAINDKVPGVIRLGIASTQPLPQSGILLKLQSAAPESELVVNQFTAKTVDGDGKVVPTTVRQQLPILSAPPQTPPDTASGTVTNPISPQPLLVTPRRGGSVSGSVTFPGGASPPGASPPGAEAPPTSFLPPLVANNKESVAPEKSAVEAAAASSGPEKRFHSQEEIVTAIERLPKPWTVAAIKAIFLKPATSSQVRQIPPVVLADGKSMVSLFLPKSLSQKLPTVGVQGCTLGSIWDAKAQGWEVELVTHKDIWPAKALLLGDGDLIQFPVVIVPILDIPAPVSGRVTIPSTDFDGTGSVNALDAYLYVGNLLAQ